MAIVDFQWILVFTAYQNKDFSGKVTLFGAIGYMYWFFVKQHNLYINPASHDNIMNILFNITYCIHFVGYKIRL